MFGHFLALIVGQRLEHTARYVAQVVGKAVQCLLRICALHLRQQEMAAGALDQGAYGTAVICSLGQIALSMARHRAALNLQRPLLNRAHALDLALLRLRRAL